MEYVILASIAGLDDSILGKKIHVNFENLGTVDKAEFIDDIEGEWNFTIVFSDTSSATDIQVGKTIDGTNFMLDDINISPISMKMNYTVNGEVEMNEDNIGVPELKGVVLKDGTRIPYFMDGDATGYTDETYTSAYQICGYDRVLDVDQVAALLVLTEAGGEMVEISIQ